jgi:hypothetical protein
LSGDLANSFCPQGKSVFRPQLIRLPYGVRLGLFYARPWAGVVSVSLRERSMNSETPSDNYRPMQTEAEAKAAKKADKKADKKAARDKANRERQMGARRRK